MTYFMNIAIREKNELLLKQNCDQSWIIYDSKILDDKLLGKEGE